MYGLHKPSRVNMKDLWQTDGIGLEIFYIILSCKRFLFLFRCLCFDDIRDRQSRKKLDRFALIIEFFDKFANNYMKACNNGEYVTIDGKMEPFRGR